MVLPPPALVVRLVEEIVLIVCRCKVVLSSGLASERFTVPDLLKVVQTAGDTLVAVAVEGVQVDTGSAVNAGVNFGAFQNRLSVCIHDAGSCCAVGVDEVGVLVAGGDKDKRMRDDLHKSMRIKYV